MLHSATLNYVTERRVRKESQLAAVLMHYDDDDDVAASDADVILLRTAAASGAFGLHISPSQAEAICL